MDEDANWRSKNIELMCTPDGFDILIICTSCIQQSAYWQERLDLGRGSLLPHDCIILVVSEDWPGGAGNALGTLYAWQNACDMAKVRCNRDLNEELTAKQSSAGMFHTAGKGTRLAPLPGSESNNKPGVKLPAGLVRRDKGMGSVVPLTILEAVIRQTSIYAKSRKGRLSVFWGDQVFIPSVCVDYLPTCHIDVLCTLGLMPDEVTWQDKGMDKYGLITVFQQGAAQVEKVCFQTANRLLAQLGEIHQVGTSLGSFSVSSILLSILLDEFNLDIESRSGRLDTDPHFWMPMTLPMESYTELMVQKGIEIEFAKSHYWRMQGVKNRLEVADSVPKLNLFGPVNVGSAAYWWDYGQLPLYVKNCRLLSGSSIESTLLRRFVGVECCSERGTLTVSDCVVTNSQIKSGMVRNSVIAFVRCMYVESEKSVLVNVTAKRIKAGSNSVIYNVYDDSEEGLNVPDGVVLVGIGNPSGGQMLVKSSTAIDGGSAWQELVLDNNISFESIYLSNQDADVSAIDGERIRAADAIWRSLCETNL